MPKIKKIKNEENIYPLKNMSNKNQCKQAFNFDVKKILKERQAESEYWKKSAELDKEIKAVDVLYDKEVNQIKEQSYSLVSPKFGYIIFNRSKYNVFFKNINDANITSLSQKLIKMSVEKNELVANIHYNNLVNANWSPALNDIQNVLFNWGADIDTLTNKPLLRCQINDYENIDRANFELVMNFVIYSIRKNNEFSDNDLLTLAKYIVTVYFDHHCGQMINVIKKLFSTCIETAFCNADETAIISFSQEFYSNYVQKDLLKIVVDLFLPFEGYTMEKIYSYITYKLYKSLLGQTNNISPFPSSINDWFVQDLVNKDYFKQKPIKVLYRIIRLLEHIVVVFNLYNNEQKLKNMYDFLSSIVKPTGLSDTQKFIHILDQWKLRLFRLHINRNKV